MYQRTAFQRLQDIAFRLRRDRARRKTPDLAGDTANHSSISSSSAWVTLAGLAEDPDFDLDRFRRHPAVLQIVETVGPTDGIHYAKLVSRHDSSLLSDERVTRVDDWGKPMRWPARLLGTPRSFAPTTLRYLATSLWLKARGLVAEGSTIIEIGVGFGGLAAMNHIISGSSTHMVDLPPVEGLARRMVRETTGATPALSRDGAGAPDGFCLVSCYAFTELAAEVQDAYFERWIHPSGSGLILSNARVFARSAGGRDDQALLSRLRDAGKKARLLDDDELLAPTDHLHGNRLIVW